MSRADATRTRWIAAALSALLAAGAAAEPTVGAERDGGEITLRFEGETSVAWVLVPTVVRRGRAFVDDLRADDFQLFVDDEPVTIQSFDRGDQVPISLIHLQDLSGSMANGGRLEAGRQALGFFLDRARGGDELALATFAAGRLTVEVPFTGDLEAHRQAMAAWRGWGSTALHDAIAWLPDIDVTGRNAKRAALLITDGMDNASTLSAATARQLVRSARLPVYVVALGDDPPPAAERAMLHRLAGATGGRSYFAPTAAAMAEACRAIAAELRHQYVLGFCTADGERRDRRLRVAVRGAGALRISHRQGYRGGPP